MTSSTPVRPPNPITGRNPIEFDAACLAFFRKLETVRIGLKDQRILRYVRQKSWDLGQTRAYIPAQAEIVRATGLYPADVTRGLKRLTEWLVIKEEPQGIYGINVGLWNAPVSKKGMRQDELLGLEPPKDPDLQEALRQDFVELCADRARRKPVRGTRACEAANPEPGEASRDVRRPSDGNGPAPAQPGSPSGRPAEGTPPPGTGCGVDGEHGSVSGSSVKESGCVSGSIVEGPAGCVPGLKSAAGACPPEVSDSLKKPSAQAGASPKTGISDSLTTPISSPNDGPGKGVVSASANIGISDSLTPGVVSPSYPLPEGNVGNGSTDQRLNAQKEGKGYEGKGGKFRHFRSKPITRPEQGYAMRLIGEFVNQCQDDMERSGGNWCGRIVRNVELEVIEQCVAVGWDLERTRPGFIKWRPAWLMWELGRRCGVKHWNEVKPGPEPVEG